MKNIIKFVSIIFYLNGFAQDKNIDYKSDENYSASNIVISLPKNHDTKIAKVWKSRKFIQNKWIHIEKDAKGYLFYDPCDGDAEQIILNNNNIKFFWRHEEPQKFKISNFKFDKENKAFSFVAYDKIDKITVNVSAKIVDELKGVVLWKINDFKWLMTPLKNIKNYRKITNVCEDYRIKELEFLPL